MDGIELEARRSTREPYDVLPQQDRGPQSPPAYNDEFITGTSDSGPQLRPSNSMPKSTLTSVESRDSLSKLAPRSFSQTPVAKCIWMHITIATTALVLIAIPVGILMLSLIAGKSTGQAPGDTYCTTGDYYTTASAGFSTIFNIDTAFGTLSFGTAKFIDLVWDIGFSRCGQAMLGWITYRVNTAALVRIMETRPVSYELFSTLSMSWSSLASLGPVMKSFFTRLGFRKKLILLWIVLSILWVALWPTITNAMTGYIAENNTLVKLKGEDGYGNFSVIGNLTNLAFQFYNLSSTATNTSRGPLAPIGPILLSSGPNATLWKELYQIVSYTKDANANVDYNTTYSDLYWTVAEVFYYYQNQTYPELYLINPNNVQCVATGVYQWGFSINITFAFTILNGFWIIGTYGVWIHMHRKSELCQKGRSLGKYRAAVDLVESIHRDLGNDICAYSEKELMEELEKQGGIKYYVEQREGDAVSHIGVTSSRDGGPVSLRFGEPYGHLRDRRTL